MNIGKVLYIISEYSLSTTICFSDLLLFNIMEYILQYTICFVIKNFVFMFLMVVDFINFDNFSSVIGICVVREAD